MEAEIARRLESELPGAQIDVVADGNRVTIRVVSAEFEGANSVKRQQRVYGCIVDLIQSGAVHAVSIQALTPDQD